MSENSQALKSTLGKLNGEKLAQFLWISVVRAIPFIDKRSLKETNNNGNLTYLFEVLESFRFLNTYEQSAIFDDNAQYRALGYIVSKNSINVLNSDLLSKTQSILNDALSLAFTLAFDHNHNDYKSKRDFMNVFIHTLDITSISSDWSQKILDLMLEDAELLRTNHKEKIYNDTNWYGDIWDGWINFLHELGGDYWADWYQRLFENRFQIIDFEEIKRHIMLPREMLKMELSVSAQWLKKLAHSEVKHLNEARIIILGEKGAGKTSLARRLINPDAPMPEEDESTQGVDITNVKLSEMVQGISEDRDANVHIWDFAGHAITHAAHRFFLSERCIYIIVYDGRTEGRNNLTYWFEHVRNYGEKSRVIVLVNLQDKHNPDIAETYFKERYVDHVCTFIRFSIKADTSGLLNFREMLAKIIAEDPIWDQRIPADYYYVKKEVENIFDKEQKNHITREEFDKIAIGVTYTEKDILLKSLTCLGICLWYPDIKGIDLLVLNPEWITRGIYKIINWLKDSGRLDASIALKDFNQVFSGVEKDYPKDKHLFLYKLMQKYELAYKKAYFEQIVVPQCLPEDSPKKSKLPVFMPETSLYVEITAMKSGNDGPRLTFPPDVLPRFIVRRSEDLRGSIVWRYGAVLKKGNVTALIEQEDYLIRLYIKGSERQNYWGELQDTLKSVLSNYHSFSVEKPEISCCVVASDGTTREMIPLKQLSNLVQYMKKKNTTSYFDPARNMEIPLNNARMYLNSEINNYFIVSEQTIVAPKGTVVGKQNKGIDIDELIRLIDTLKGAIPSEVDVDDKVMIEESVKAIEEELRKDKPQKGKVNILLKGLNTVIKTAEFGAAVTSIIQFVQGLNF